MYTNHIQKEINFLTSDKTFWWKEAGPVRVRNRLAAQRFSNRGTVFTEFTYKETLWCTKIMPREWVIKITRHKSTQIPSSGSWRQMVSLREMSWNIVPLHLKLDYLAPQHMVWPKGLLRNVTYKTRFQRSYNIKLIYQWPLGILCGVRFI